MNRRYKTKEHPEFNPDQVALIENLVNVAIEGLHDMYIPEKEVFAFKKKKIEDRIILEDTNNRYDLINLIGMHKAKCNAYPVKLNLEKILETKINNADKFDGAGDIGLLLWATSLISPDKLANIVTKINFNNILESYPDAKNKLTMELSWLLTGLLMASIFNQTINRSIGNLPEEIFKILRNNYGGSGIFRHQNSKCMSGRLRGHIGSFADQVYPIMSFTLYSRIKKNDEALLIAIECSDKICENQGENGEWAWHYDSRTGKVISKYPVYSVHQDAMAPMALYAVEKASTRSYQKFINKGLDWIINNPKNSSMIDFENNLIWRAVGPQRTHRKLKSTLANLGLPMKDEYNNLETVKECWSYHLGWILHTFSGRINNLEIYENSINSKNNDFKLYNIK